MFNISLIIPTCNRSALLKEALDSIEEQNYNDLEVIIVDDNSDVPVDVTKFNYDFELKLIRNSVRLGGAEARNVGIRESTGKYICFLDDDDILVGDKLNKFFSYLESRPNVDAVFGVLERMSGKVLTTNKPNGVVCSISQVKHLSTNTSLIRREVFETIAFYSDLKKFQDTQFHIELIKNYNVHFVDCVVSLWRDNHSLHQITSMTNKNDRVRSLDNFVLLYKYITNRYSLSVKEHFFFLIKILKQKIQILLL